MSGTGAAPLNNRRGEAAAAEISRSQVWQWVRHGAITEHGRQIDASYVRGVADAVMDRIEEEVGPDIFLQYRFKEARDLFEEVALGEHFIDFLTLPAIELLD